MVHVPRLRRNEGGRAATADPKMSEDAALEECDKRSRKKAAELWRGDLLTSPLETRRYLEWSTHPNSLMMTHGHS